MNQNIICKVQQCSFYSSSGFCLNKLTIINSNGVCNYLTKPDWNIPIEDWMKNNFREDEKITVKKFLEEKEGEDKEKNID